MPNPARGDIWFTDLNPIRGHEQGGARPCVIISANPFNESFLDLVVVLPITSKKKEFPSHLEIPSRESGLKLSSFIKCEDIRSISKERLVRRMGRVSALTMQNIEDKLKIILDFQN